MTLGAIEVKNGDRLLAHWIGHFDEPLGLEEIRFVGFPVKFAIPLVFAQGDTLTISFSNPKEPQ